MYLLGIIRAICEDIRDDTVHLLGSMHSNTVSYVSHSTVVHVLIRSTNLASVLTASQNARAKGGVTAEHREELQQMSRKAKRAVKRQEEERKKARFVSYTRTCF